MDSTRARLVISSLGCKAALVSLAVGSLQAQVSIPQDRQSLEHGEDAGMAVYADMNGYPSPKRILEMQDQLTLSDEQLKDVESIFDAMSESARAKGDAIIKKEVELEKLFSTGKANEVEAKKVSREIGVLRGELRAIHLAARIQARHILTNKQLAIYDSILTETRQRRRTP